MHQAPRLSVCVLSICRLQTLQKQWLLDSNFTQQLKTPEKYLHRTTTKGGGMAGPLVEQAA